MPEILTESFCERCGTRYTFESVAPRKTRRLGQFKTLSRGVKNWVMSDDSSLDEALAAARSDEEREVTAQQLDAFHSTFNFCMNCRQYTCANCWNGAEGRCLSCAPNLGHEILPAPFPDVAPFEPARLEAGAWPEIDLAGGAGNGAGLDVASMPVGATPGGNGVHPDEPSGNGLEHDEPADVDAVARLAFLAGDGAPATAEPAAPTESPAAEPPTAELAGDPATAGLAWPDETTVDPSLVDVAGAPPTEEVAADEAPEPAWATRADVPVEPSAAEATLPEETDERAAALTARTSDLLARFRPGQNIDAELEAYEAQREADELAAAESGREVDEAAIQAEPVEAIPVEEAAWLEGPAAEEPLVAEPASIPTEPEPVYAEPEPVQPEPVAARAEPAEPAPAPTPAARDDIVEQPTWRIFAPDQTTPTVGQPVLPGAAPAPAPIQASGEPQWPARPDIDQSPSMALLANRDRTSSDALWAASAREVLGGPLTPAAPAPVAGVQPCSSCGLSLSANARFCRRCGTRQG